MTQLREEGSTAWRVGRVGELSLTGGERFRSGSSGEADGNDVDIA